MLSTGFDNGLEPIRLRESCFELSNIFLSARNKNVVLGWCINLDRPQRIPFSSNRAVQKYQIIIKNSNLDSSKARSELE